MRIVQDALSEAETEELSAMLEEGSAHSLPFARGVFTAVASAPTHFEPTEWFPLLLGGEVPNASHLKRLLALLMREFNACADCLALSVPAVPAVSDEEALTQFSKGYVQIAQRDTAWTSNPDAFELTAPLMILSGYASAAALESIDRTISADEDAYRKKHRECLADDVAALFDFFKEAREKRAPAPAESSEKTGRNDPCPCGSGKKYKKCCLE